ncbi:hypothetical protein ACI4B7_28765, partial [Klebsiella pneumoniae]|uniref:hypothetical protein n=1 Tax=Klebsiella pneumoniae TaxID=573 RepID=UPI00385265AE
QIIKDMKKLFLLATAALLVTGVSFAHGGDGKKCGKCDKECCKKGDKKEVKKEDKKAIKPATKA